jgi:hypothetical protein
MKSRFTERIADLTVGTEYRCGRWLQVLRSHPHGREESSTNGLGNQTLKVLVLNLVLVGLLEALQMAGTIASGGHYLPGMAFRDLMYKLPWAMVLCFALWLAITVGHARPLVVGLMGLLIAPLASIAAHSLAIGAENYALTVKATQTLPPLVAAGVKGIEYACFGAVIAWLRTRRWAHARHHACAGLCIGMIFGGYLLILAARTETLTPVLLIGWLVNQLLFPVACALILFHVTRGARTASDTHSHERDEPEKGARTAHV